MNNEKQGLTLDLRGIDMVTPVDLLSDGRTPWSKNFRLYAQQSDDRQVAISSRKGPGHYVDPLVEVITDSETSTGDGSTTIGVTANVSAWKINSTTAGRINRLDLRVRSTPGVKGPLLVSLYSDKDGRPSDLLSQSSVNSGDISSTFTWKTLRFHNAPLTGPGESIWAVVEIQDDGVGFYEIETVSTDTSQYSDVSFAALEPVNYAPLYRAYTSPDQRSKGGYRFNREDGANITVAVYGSTLYAIDPQLNQWKVVHDGLNPLATEYSFTRGDGKVFWVNGFDDMMSWDGTFQADNTSIIPNGSFTGASTGWTVYSGSAVTRDTAVFASSPASMRITKASAGRGADRAIATQKNKIYKYSVKFRPDAVSNVSLEAITAVGGTNVQGITSVSNPAGVFTTREGYFTANQNAAGLRVYAENNFYVDDISIIDTGIEVIKDTELPILSMILFHKDRLFGVSASDKNRIIWSEAPGNPSNAPINEQWYRQYLSTSFWYIPAPKTGSPVTGLVSFQDSLVIFTQDNKYIFSGSDKGSFFLRESTGSKGALSMRGITKDENFIYFVADDGFYEFNGSKDTNITEQRIQPLFDGCPSKYDITPIVWKNKVRWYMASSTSSVNDICPIYNRGLDKEWELDLGTYVDRAIYYDDADDNSELIEFSSHYAMVMLAEQEYSSLGCPIDFEYRLKYDSMGLPAQKKRLRRYYPILQGVDNTFKIQISMDKDFQNNPRIKDVLLSVNGSTWGNFTWGDGTTWGGDKSFKHHRQSYSGSAYYWQLRVARKGVNNRVAFTGAQYKYRIKRM